MNYKKAIGMSSSLLFLILIAFKFQNCGQAGAGDASDPVFIDGDQAIVDDLGTQKVSFEEQLIIVRDDADETIFHGTCARTSSGLVLVAKVVDVETREEITSISSECYPGGFTLNVPKISDLSCEKDYALSVESVNGDKALLNLRRKCEPLTKIFVNSETRPAGEYSCYIEKQDAGSACEQVCYMDKKLFTRDEVSDTECN